MKLVEILVAAAAWPLAYADLVFPENRYGEEWDLLDNVTMDAALDLNYYNDTWNLVSRASMEELSYESVVPLLKGTQQASLDHLVENEESWDCYMNHYDDYDWAEIADEPNLLGAFTALGWTETMWDSGDPFVSSSWTEGGVPLSFSSHLHLSHLHLTESSTIRGQGLEPTDQG